MKKYKYFTRTATNLLKEEVAVLSFFTQLISKPDFKLSNYKESKFYPEFKKRMNQALSFYKKPFTEIIKDEAKQLPEFWTFLGEDKQKILFVLAKKIDKELNAQIQKKGKPLLQ